MLIEATKERIVHLSGAHSVKPGVNHMPDDVWAAAKKMPLIKNLIDAGELVEHGGPDGSKSEAAQANTPPADPLSPPPVVGINQRPLAPEAAKALLGKNVKDAEKLVESTFDRALLEAWAVEENRKTVLDAIEKQLDKVARKTTDTETKTQE